MPRFRIRTLLVLCCVTITASAVHAEKNWTGWRGPRQDGHAEEKGLPSTWGKANVAWKTPIEGEGQSSPVIWGDRIFLTSAPDRGARRTVLCIDRNDGSTLWEKVAWTGKPEPSHKMNGWASATCATDGERVYAFFGHAGGLFCYSLEGNLVWKKDLGEFAGPWGTASCPVLVGDLVIQNCDADENAYITALDKKTGEEVWKTKRPDIRGWSTPILVEAGGRKELVVNGHHGVRGYDPATGKELWFCKSFNGRGSPTVTPAGDLLVTINGLPGPIYAIKPGGSGDVSETHRAWATKRGGGRDLPSPIVVDGYVLVVNMNGILTCYEAKSGKQLWQERLGGNFAASPIAYDGMAFFVALNGETVAIKPGPKPNIVARNTVGAGDEEIFRACLTPSDGQIFLRANSALYCIGKRKPAAE